MLCLQLCFILGFWLVHGYENLYGTDDYQYQAIVLIVSQLVVILFANNYGGVLRRNRFDELLSVIKHIIEILVVVLVYLFIVHNSATAQAIKYAEAGVLKKMRRATATSVCFIGSWTQAQRFRMTERSSLIQPQQFHFTVICSTRMKNGVGG